MKLPENFTVIPCTRKIEKKGELPAMQLAYKGVVVALFIDSNGSHNLKDRVVDHIKTYGYLAEWTRLKYVNGSVPSWDDSMFVDIGTFADAM